MLRVPASPWCSSARTVSRCSAKLANQSSLTVRVTSLSSKRKPVSMGSAPPAAPVRRAASAAWAMAGVTSDSPPAAGGGALTFR